MDRNNEMDLRENLTGIYYLTLRASDGRERKYVAYLPNLEARLHFMEKSRANRLEVIVNDESQ